MKYTLNIHHKTNDDIKCRFHYVEIIPAVGDFVSTKYFENDEGIRQEYRVVERHFYLEPESGKPRQPTGIDDYGEVTITLEDK